MPTLRRYWALWAVLLAAASFGFAFLGFSVRDGALQVLCGALAVACLLLYLWGWQRFPALRVSERAKAAWSWIKGAAAAARRLPGRIMGAVGNWWGRTRTTRGGDLVRFVALVVSSLLAFVGALIGAALVLGQIIADDTQPMWIGSMYIGLAVVAAALLLLVTWWARAFARIVRPGREPPLWVDVVVAVLVLAAGLTLLSLRETPSQNANAIEQARQAGVGRFDLLLVVDPADEVTESLVRAAGRAVADPKLAQRRADELFAGSPAGGRYDVAIGLAVPQREQGEEPLWRLVEPPTTDYVELADALARLPTVEGPTAAGSYGRVLAGTLEPGRAHWRRASQLGVAFLLESLPSLSELDGKPGALELLSGGCRSGPEGDLGTDESKPVRWAKVLEAHCRRRKSYAAWEAEGRPAPEPERPVAVHVLSREARPTRDLKWRDWVRTLDGDFRRPAAGYEVDGSAGRLFQAAVDMHTGVPSDELADVALWFRPHLYFDREERFLPVDADWLLRNPPKPEAGEQPKRHRVCDHDTFGDNCDDVTGGASLIGSLDEYIDFAGGVRFGQDLERAENAPARMYVHVRKLGDRLYLGYWWYLEYNVSPWRREVNCLPGLTFKDASCHDHEGDWEGVTVELRVDNDDALVDRFAIGNLTPLSVIYAAHSQRVRWKWADLELAADEGFHATHPVVYVAIGSHAAYPARCGDEECTQELANLDRPEGRFDGGKEWPPNDPVGCRPKLDPSARTDPGPCLVALPSTRDGRFGLLWNAFPGRWGRAHCTIFAKVCSQTDGPRSPSLQARYERPAEAEAGNRERLKAAQHEHGMTVGMDLPRWPPKPWPPREGDPAPRTPALE